jgi:hypothetical protein
MHRILVLLFVLMAGTAAQAAAQGSTRVEIRVDSTNRDPYVRIRNLLQESRWRDALENALPITMHWTVKLMRSRAILPATERTVEFKIVARQEQLLGHYTIAIEQPNRPRATPSRYTSEREFLYYLEREISLPDLAPRREGNWYYTVELRISTLEEDELRQAERAAGRTQGGVLDAIAQGILRMVGLPTAVLTGSTPGFRIP